MNKLEKAFKDYADRLEGNITLLEEQLELSKKLIATQNEAIELYKKLLKIDTTK